MKCCGFSRTTNDVISGSNRTGECISRELRNKFFRQCYLWTMPFLKKRTSHCGSSFHKSFHTKRNLRRCRICLILLHRTIILHSYLTAFIAISFTISVAVVSLLTSEWTFPSAPSIEPQPSKDNLISSLSLLKSAGIFAE